MTKTVLSLLGGFIVGILIIWGWNTYSERTSARDISATTTTPTNLIADTGDTSDSELDTTAIEETSTIINTDVVTAVESSHIGVRDQAFGSMVNVASVTLETDGWIVVHEEQNGFIANALGAKRRDAGQHSNLMIPLLRDTVENSRYWIVLYTDDGDRQFNLQTDFPLRDSEETPITSSFKTI